MDNNEVNQHTEMGTARAGNPMSLSSFQSKSVNKGVVSLGSVKGLAECGFNDYKQARVERLRELYSEMEPNYKYKYLLPAGETDGRKCIKTETNSAEALSPFDLENFEELMPDWKDYVNKYRD
mgnify:CR=1 FL=1|tara:strand:- start:101 stop:469 length:369 start_codon:yes stop_codon:yes gene_type:complete